MEDRLLKILKHYNLSSAAFADKLGVQRSSISHLLSGRNKPSFDFLTRLLIDFPEINIEWFINGEGYMIKQQQNTAERDLFTKKYETREADTIMDEKQMELNANTEVTNVNNNKVTNVKQIKNIVIYYNNYTWEEFLPAQS